MRFSYLDGLRGMAALFVLALHWNFLFKLSFSKSYLAVDLFFMLSGFVLAHAYEAKLRSGAMTPDAFMRNRLTRLYPLYALSVLVATGLQAARSLTGTHGGPAVGEWMVAGVFALSFLPWAVAGASALFAMNVCYWSLSQEVLVNLIYGYACRAAGKAAVPAVVCVTGVALVALAVSTGSLDHGYQFNTVSLVGGCTRAFFGIGMGMLLYRHRDRLRGIGRLLPAWCAFPLVAMVFVAPPMPHGWLFDLASVLIVLPLATVVAAASEPTSAWQLRTMHALGNSSYPLYLLHVPFATVAYKVASTVPGWERSAATVMAGLLFLLCLQLDKRFDVPVRAWLRTRGPRLPALQVP
ncbi:acyltransferase [[Empedobacter] haloabium]|uniref:Acyltransferase n=1 Tax=[Empedobacter] haloabium TaxID=592317 RepID=A0ABZ1UMT3_9BURK